MSLPRVVGEEMLDGLAPDDPAARRSRRDLLRVHRAMGTRALMARGWARLISPECARQPLRVLELGAGDGLLLLGVAGALPAWRRVQLSLLDRQDIVSAATRAAYAAQGWVTQVQVVDALAWARGEGAALHEPAKRWDLITTTLFLHHFKADQLRLLLAAAAARCDRFFACEPSRSWRALAGSHLVAAIGANAVTRADAVLSVHAGFRGEEISALWPQAGERWRLREGSAGLFSHCFSAERKEGAP